MFTRDNILMFLIIAVFLLIPFVFWYTVDEKSSKCEQQGGVLVKTSTGWQCIDSKVLI